MTVEATRTRILRAAARCIAQTGVRGLRVGDVARQAGVSSGLLYYHFADRDGLLAATLAHVNETAWAGRGPAPDAATDARRALIDNLVEELSDAAAIRDNAIAWNEIGASAVFDPALAAHLNESNRQWRDFVASAVRAGQTQGRIDAALEAEDFAITATALVEGLSQRWLTGQLSTDEARRLLTTSLERGLGPPPTKPK